MESWEDHAAALGLNPYDLDAMETWGRDLSSETRDEFLHHAIATIRLADHTPFTATPARHVRPRTPRVMRTCRPRVRIH